jgi:hypothetical protein
MAKPLSRTKRWAAACAEVRKQLDHAALLQEQADEARNAIDFSELQAIKEEFSEWSIPEGLENSPMGEKLSALEDLDLEPDMDDMDAIGEALDNAEGADLPLGFGRD